VERSRDGWATKTVLDLSLLHFSIHKHATAKAWTPEDVEARPAKFHYEVAATSVLPAYHTNENSFAQAASGYAPVRTSFA
jgi:hypothetical protein